MANVTKNDGKAKDSWILKGAKKLPESNILFLVLIGIIIIFSFLLQGTYDGAVAGADGVPATYKVINLLSKDGFLWFLYNFIPNFVKYPPLGIVIVGAIGFSFAEKAGLLGALIKKVGIVTPEKFILPVIIFLGINSSVASDAGYIVLIPLAGALYAGLGKNPLIGIVAAFAAVSAGFGAALMPTPGDALLGSITQKITLESGFQLTLDPVTMNYVFMIASTFALTVIITIATKKFTEKSVNSYKYEISEEMKNSDVKKMTELENKGLKNALLAIAALVLLYVVLYFTGFLQNQETYIDYANNMKVLEVPIRITPIISNIIVIMIAIFLFPSIAYARTTGLIMNSKDYIKLTVSGMRDMAYILVFAVFAGNFLAFFSISGLANYIANHGAFLLLSMNVTSPVLLMVMFIFVSAFINLFMGSASAKWNILAPVFIPMLLIASNQQLGPEIIQAGYRIADSSTNVISPLMTYTGVIILSCKKYIPEFEFGDLMALMLPHSLIILVSWTLFFVIWMLTGLPFGL